MRPIAFPEQTVVVAKDQPPYLPLPAYQSDRETISLWALTWRERFGVLIRGKLWLRQCNFSRAVQPVRICASSPFEEAR